MSVRKAIRILVKYRTIKEQTEDAEKDYKDLYEWIDWVASIPSPVQKMTGMPGTGNTSKATEDYALRRIELGEQHYEELKRRSDKVNSLIRFKMMVDYALKCCTTMEEEIVTRRWIRKEQMVDIAKDMVIGRATAYRYQWKAFDKIEEVFWGEDINTIVDVSEIDDTEREMLK